jgi:hypothetical protein
MSCFTVIFCSNVRTGYIYICLKMSFIQNFLLKMAFIQNYSAINESCVTEILVQECLKQEF